MPYIDTNTRTTSPLSNEKQQPLGRVSLLHGVYVGFIKDASDVQRNGRLRVWIPEMGTAPDEEQGWMIVNYCSPFAGATNVETISKANIQQFEGTQTSYGMWMIPPDINNQVLVMFANGDASRGFWIGCLFNQFMNNMVPAMASSSKNYQYPGKDIPVAEYNKWDTKTTQPDKTIKPYESTKFNGVGNQGLINDQGRGITTSSARRESPSSVFGIITPGPVIDNTVSPENIRRKGGSSFVMDDTSGSEYVQLTTKSGAQIKLDETNGFVYLINRDGTAWVQMDKDGNIDIFGAASISVRAQEDINFRADRNINIEAGQNIFMKAAKDTVASTTTFTYDVNNIPTPTTIPFYKYVGEGAGEGGNIVTQALNNIHTTVKNDLYLTIDKNLEIKVSDLINIDSNDFNLTSPSIKNVGAVKIRGTLDVTGLSHFGNSLGIANSLNATTGSFSGGLNATTGSFSGGLNATTGSFSGQVNSSHFVAPTFDIGSSGAPGTAGTAGPAVNISVAPDVIPAEIKQPTEKINILATWADPSSKFKRNSESFNTTLSVMPTYEPCPEHETFTFNSIYGYVPPTTEASRTYQGSGGSGNDPTNSPPTNTTPGSGNTDISATPANQNAITKDFNMNAYECQLKIHEGVKYVSYLDSVNLPTGGIGHLLRVNEIIIYPIGTPISPEQVSQWFQQDSVISISGAMRLLGTDVWGNLSDVRKRACADLCYNLGESRLSKFTKFISAMKIERYDLAGQALRNSKWFTQVGQRGPNIINMIVNDVDSTGCGIKYPV